MLVTNILREEVHDRLMNIFYDTIIFSSDVQIHVRYLCQAAAGKAGHGSVPGLRVGLLEQ